MPNDETILTLPIQKIYFDEILAGRKTVEYRNVTQRMTSMLFKVEKRILKVHYYRPGLAVFADIARIVKIPTPDWIRELEIEFGAETYAIHIKRPRLSMNGRDTANTIPSPF